MQKALIQALEPLGFKQATPIQKKSYEVITEGKNTLLISPTGSGKTLAFTLPIIQKLKANHELQWLVLAPTQELAGQLRDVIQAVTKDKALHTVLLVGGGNLKRQQERLKQKPEIVVGTLGRVLTFFNKKKLKSPSLEVVTVDEVDQMMTTEHQKEMDELNTIVMASSQWIFVMGNKDKAVKDFLINHFSPLEVINTLEEDQSRENLHHGYLWVPIRKRENLLRQLAQLPDFHALVFVRTLAEMEKLVEQLRHDHLLIESLSSQQTDSERKRAIQRFQRKEVTYLLATDVLSRGLDLPDLEVVIQYDLSEEETTYWHRSGRTGRMGREGWVFSFVNEGHRLRQLKQQLPKGAELEPFYLKKGVLLQGEDPKKKNHLKRKDRPKNENKDKLVESQDHSPLKTKSKHKVRQKKRKNKGARRPR